MVQEISCCEFVIFVGTKGCTAILFSQWPSILAVATWRLYYNRRSFGVWRCYWSYPV